MPGRKLLALGVVLGSVITAGCSHSSTPAALAPGQPAPAFRIVYRIEQPNVPVRWGELIAERPFLVRSGTYDHLPTAGERPDNGTLTTIDRLYQLRTEGVQEISGRQPAPGTGDQYLVSGLAEAVRRGLAQPVGDATLVGRRCTVYRFREPPIGPIKELAGADHDDLCLTGNGLLLREAWTLKGKVVLRRTAVRVDLHRSDRAFDVTGAAPAPESGPLAEPAPPGSSFVPDPAPPPGYTLARREAFVLRQPSDAGPVALYVSTVWAFTDGPQVVSVEAGDSSATGQLPWLTTDPSRHESLPAGAAESVVRNDGMELRVDLGNNRWLRVRGTVPAADLLRYARTLRTS